MSDEATGTNEMEETPLADDELDEVAGGKIINRGGASSDQGDDERLPGDENFGDEN